MDKYSKAVLADAKQEYTQQLIDFIKQPIHKGIQSIYDLARKKSSSKNLNTLKTFQLLLSKTPKWSDELIDSEVLKIKKACDCDYLEDLITAVFVTHTKILTSIKVKNKVENIDLNIPKISYFIHKIYIQCARNFWRQPWLFHTGYNSLDLQRNIIESEKIITESIKETIRVLLPVKSVLKQYLGNNFIDKDFDKYEDEDITSVISEHTKDNIRQLLKHEFGNNLQPISENKDFATMSISEEKIVNNKVDKEPNLSPENFDNRGDDEISIDNTTRIETAPHDTSTQIEEEDDVSDTQTRIEDISILNEVQSTNTNIENNFSFFDDAADF